MLRMREEKEEKVGKLRDGKPQPPPCSAATTYLHAQRGACPPSRTAAAAYPGRMTKASPSRRARGGRRSRACSGREEKTESRRLEAVGHDRHESEVDRGSVSIASREHCKGGPRSIDSRWHWCQGTAKTPAAARKHSARTVQAAGGSSGESETGHAGRARLTQPTRRLPYAVARSARPTRSTAPQTA